KEKCLTTENEPELPLEAKPPDEVELQEATQTELQQLKEAARFATPDRAAIVLEALLFAAEKPLDIGALEDATQFSRELLQSALAEVQKKYAPGAGGVVLLDLGGRWQLRTDHQVAPYVRRMLQVKPMRLTRAALETLAIIAYRQPITRPEIEDLRGVDSGAVAKRIAQAGAESESALAALESAMDRADASTKNTAQVLAPPPPPEPPKEP